MDASTPSSGAVRASDTEREQAVQRLGAHYVEGRLDRDEFDERAGAALAARTRDELRELLRDLPQPAADPAQERGPARMSPWGPGRFTRRLGPASGVAPALVLLVPLLLAVAIGAVVHGVPPFPLIPLLFILIRRQRRWRREAQPWI